MRKTIKMLTMAALCGVTVISGVVSLSNFANNSHDVQAADCEHVGYHYVAHDASYTESGNKEYWVCCKCHQHYVLGEPGTESIVAHGEWTTIDAKPELTYDPNDSRYIESVQEEKDIIVPSVEVIEETHIEIVPAQQSETGKKEVKVVDQDGEDTGLIIEPTTENVDGYKVVGYTGDSKTVIIPEGVEKFEAWRDVFNGKTNPNASQIETVIVASTVQTVEEYAFEDLPNLKTLIIKAHNVNWGCVINCPSLKSVYIASSVGYIAGQAFNNYAKTQQTDPNHLEISCEVTKRPSAWDSYWNIINWNNGGTFYDVGWGVKY